MAEKRKSSAKKEKRAEKHETEFRGRRIRIERPAGDRVGGRLFIDREEIEVEHTESGVIGHEMMFKEYGSLEELAEDIVRQRGTAEIERGEHPH